MRLADRVWHLKSERSSWDAACGGTPGGFDGIAYSPNGVTCGKCRAIIEGTAAPAAHDPVNHPRHYTAHPSGVECVDVAEHYTFNVGNAIKYLWRAGLKGNAVEDLRKAAWYATREANRLEKAKS